MVVEDFVKMIQGLTPESRVIIRRRKPFIDMAPNGQLYIEECGEDDCLYYTGIQQQDYLGSPALFIEIGRKPWNREPEAIELLRLAVNIIDGLYSQQAMPDDSRLPDVMKIMAYIEENTKAKEKEKRCPNMSQQEH